MYTGRPLLNAGMTCCLLLFVMNSALAFDQGCQKPAGCTACCQSCVLACCPEIKTVKEKKHTWDVECDHVCIPKVHCPLVSWLKGGSCLTGMCTSSDDCCSECGSSNCQGNCCSNTPLCAKVRAVRKLKKVEYETEKTVVEWTVKKYAMSGCKCCNGAAPHMGCSPCGE